MFLGRAPAAGEPVWLPEDRGYALAWQDHQRDLCAGCGHSLAATTDPGAQGGYAGELLRCHACAAQAQTVSGFVDAGGDPAGLLIRWTTTPDTT